MACAFSACISEGGCVEAVPRGEDGQVLTQVGGVPVWQDPVISPLVPAVIGHIIATYTNELGDSVDIQETITRLYNVIAPGNRIGTYDNEDGDSVDIYETITTLTDALPGGNPIGTYTNEEGDAVPLFETITLLTNALGIGHLIGTYTNEDGQAVNIRETITDLQDNGNGSFTFTNEEGINVTWAETLTAITGALAAGHVIGTYTNENGTAVTLRETVTTLVQNPNGSLTYTDENGTAINVTPKGVVTTLTNTLAAGNVIGTYTNEDGVAVPIRETVTTLAGTQATGKVIGTYTNEAGAAVPIRETVTTLVANPDGSFTYTNENGQVTNVPCCETVTTLTGTQATGKVIGTYTNEAGAAVPIRETVTTLVVNPDGSFTYTNENGQVTNVPAGAETVTTLVVNPDGSFTYTNEAGIAVNVPPACPNIVITSANTCAAGGIGADYMIRSASWNQGTCTLTLNGAPEHTSISGQVEAPFTPIAVAPGNQVIQQLQATITNPSTCRNMEVLVNVRPGRPAAVLGAPENRWQFWMDPFANTEPMLGGGTIARWDSRNGATWQGEAYPAGTEQYVVTLAPGASATYGFTIEFQALAFVNHINNQSSIGRGYITWIGSTV